MSRSGLKAPSSIKARNFRDQYADSSVPAWLWAPTHKTKAGVKAIAKSCVMEYLASFVHFFCVVYAVVAAVNASPADVGVQTIIVALVSGGSYYMVTGWLRMPEDELPRHASSSITLSRLLTLRFGLVLTLLYWLVQFAAYVSAAGLLLGIGLGAATSAAWVPASVGTYAQSWGIEILASGLIIFTGLYNNMAGVKTEDEDLHHRNSEVATALVRGVVTFLFFHRGHWSFDPAVYLTGLFATGYSGAFLTAQVEVYIVAPFVGMAIAILLYYLMLFLSDYEADPAVVKRKDLGNQLPHTQYVKLSE